MYFSSVAIELSKLAKETCFCLGVDSIYFRMIVVIITMFLLSSDIYLIKADITFLKTCGLTVFRMGNSHDLPDLQTIFERLVPSTK